MGLLDRLLRRKRVSEEAEVADRARQRRMPSAASIQTQDEQDDTRRRMEADLDTQRERRSQAAPPDA
jgi:hypothetical protein